MKHLSIKPLSAALLTAGLCIAALPASAAEYQLTDLGSLGGMHALTYATGINNSRQVVGFGYQIDPHGGGSGVSHTGDYQAFVTGAAGQGITGLGMFAGSSWSKGTAINDVGQVIGASGGASSPTDAFFANGASSGLRRLGSLGAGPTTANGINASGQVVGVSNGQAYLTAANGGAMTALNTTALGTVHHPAANGVNDGGQVVGNYSSYDYYQLGPGFITGPNGAAPHTLPGRDVYEGNDGYSPKMNVTAVNAEGQTVGSYNERGALAFLKNADGSDVFLDFGAAPHFDGSNMGGWGQYGPRTHVYGLALNDAGQVGGSMTRMDLPGNNAFAFITDADGSNLQEVNSLSFVNHSGPFDFTFTSTTGINDAGDFVVNASNGHAYLVTVVPEPETLALLLAGLGLVGLRARGKKRMTGAASTGAAA